MQTFFILFRCCVVCRLMCEHHLLCEHYRIIIAKGWGRGMRPCLFFIVESPVGQAGLKLIISEDDLELRLPPYLSGVLGLYGGVTSPDLCRAGIESKVT